MSGSFLDLRLETPFIRHEAGVLSLHFTIGETQSSMHVDRPGELYIDYTRTMMGFLLLHPRPARIAMIGLGGGSLVKFCHRHLPGARIEVVENNPGVIALRKEFALPDDDERLEVIEGDGAAFVRDAPAGTIDVLMVDGFDCTGQPPQLCSQTFYDECLRVLAPGGVLVVNLHYDHPQHALFMQRIARSFRGNAMQVLAPEKSNCVVFAGKEIAVTLAALRSLGWSDALPEPLQRRMRSEFAHIGWHARPLDAAPDAQGSGRVR